MYSVKNGNKEMYRRDAILVAAGSVFRARGYGRATAEEIAAAAGLAVGSLYNILGNKECIGLAAAERVGEEIMAGLERFQLLVRKSPDRALAELVAFRLSNYMAQRLFFELCANDEYRHVGSGNGKSREARERLEACYQRYFEWVADIFRNGVDIGLFVEIEPRHAVFMLEGMIDGAWRGISCREDKNGDQVIAMKDMAASCVSVFAGRREKKLLSRLRNDREIFITRFDFQRLKELVEVARFFNTEKNECYLRLLENALQRATIVSSETVPPDVVTMNSRVLLYDATENRRIAASLVFPSDKNKDIENTSVLSPLGAALLGYAEGCRIEAGPRELLIEKVLYQPEASGDYEL